MCRNALIHYLFKMQFHRCAARKPTACIQIQGKIIIKIYSSIRQQKLKEKKNKKKTIEMMNAKMNDEKQIARAEDTIVS